jgi:glycyl-tRNA synthetase beta chain
MVAIAVRHGLRYDVEKLVERARAGLEKFPGLVERTTVVPEATAFVLERLAKSLTDDGIARDTVDAVLPTSGDFIDLRLRAEALQAFRAGPRWEDLITVYTRPANLARKLPPAAASQVATESLGGVSPALFQAEAERLLLGEWWQAAADAATAAGRQDYGGALTILAGLRPVVDRYFDDVLVMADDEPVRLNRLRQLAAVAGTVKSIAWLEYIQG